MPPLRRAVLAAGTLALALASGLPSALGGAAPAASSVAAPVEITLRALPDQMRFDVAEFKVFVGDRVRLVFRNEDSMPHNVVVCLPRAAVTPGAEEDNAMEVAVAAWSLGEQATARQWVPDHPRVFAASKILDGLGTDVIEFTVPDRPGSYPYVCTYPGHAASMFGAMQVQARVEGLRDLNYRVYRGPFTEFPDFAALTEKLVARGPLPDGLIEAKVGGDEPSFAVEFEGVLSVPRDGAYTFTVAGDNGPVLWIDGREVLDHRRGGSAESSASKTVTLARGERRLVLQYWHRRDRRKPQPEVTLLWSSNEFKELPLSRLDLLERRREQERERAIGLPLGPENDEPIVYRNYLAGVMPSGFGVGYPGGANVTWDPVRMNVGSVWAGAFYDVKRHRTQRGGSIRPIGFAIVDPAPGRSLAYLPHPAAPWPADDAPAADKLGFLGYSLDERRRPTFRYRLGEITVSEFFLPHGTAAGGNLRLTRRLTLNAATPPPSGLMFRVLHGPNIEVLPEGYRLQKEVRVTTSGAAVMRSAGSAKEVLLPVVFRNGRAELEVTYAWGEHHL